MPSRQTWMVSAAATADAKVVFVVARPTTAHGRQSLLAESATYRDMLLIDSEEECVATSPLVPHAAATPCAQLPLSLCPFVLPCGVRGGFGTPCAVPCPFPFGLAFRGAGIKYTDMLWLRVAVTEQPLSCGRGCGWR